MNYPTATYNSADIFEIFFEKRPHVVRHLGNNIDVMIDKENKNNIVGAIVWNVSDIMARTLTEERSQMFRRTAPRRIPSAEDLRRVNDGARGLLEITKEHPDKEIVLDAARALQSTEDLGYDALNALAWNSMVLLQEWANKNA